MSRILIVDDDPHIVRTLEIMLQGDGHDVVSAGSAEDGLARLAEEGVDVALVDLALPGMSGIDLLGRIRAEHEGVEVVIVTAHGSVETAVRAMKEGAFDYVTKPFSPEQVRHRLRQIERVRHLTSEVLGLRRRVGELPFEPEIVTHSAVMKRVLEVAASVAATDATLCITGESGTGKTRLARLVHASSHRKAGPFLVVDCTAFHESLLESELFGHKRGAFTGAVSDKQGKVELAASGTLFLDEVGEIPLHLQSKLLRLVEERRFERLGDPTVRSIDARVIAATNRDLEEMVREKAFREDLFYRLNVVELAIPALRNRPEDILLLGHAFLETYARMHDRRVTGMSPEVERALVRHPWPGNIRELGNAIERAVLLASGRMLGLDNLPPRFSESATTRDDDGGRSESDGILPIAELEEREIRKALTLDLPLEETARRLGVDPSTLWRKRKKYGL